MKNKINDKNIHRNSPWKNDTPLTVQWQLSRENYHFNKPQRYKQTKSCRIKKKKKTRAKIFSSLLMSCFKRKKLHRFVSDSYENAYRTGLDSGPVWSSSSVGLTMEWTTSENVSEIIGQRNQQIIGMYIFIILFCLAH